MVGAVQAKVGDLPPMGSPTPTSAGMYKMSLFSGDQYVRVTFIVAALRLVLPLTRDLFASFVFKLQNFNMRNAIG